MNWGGEGQQINDMSHLVFYDYFLKLQAFHSYYCALLDHHRTMCILNGVSIINPGQSWIDL